MNSALPPLSLWRRSPPLSGRPTILQIAVRVAELHGVTVAEIMSHDRTVRVYRARLAVYVACRAADYSLGQIAHRLGDRDRTTVLKALQREERRAA